MTRVRLKGINKVKKTLADGSVKEFFYLRSTKARLPGKPGSPEFIASYNAAVAHLAKERQPPAGEFRSLIARFKASAEFVGLKPKTKIDYMTHILRIESEFGDMPIAAIEDTRSRGDFLEWRDGMSSKPRSADYGWTVLARIMSWAKNRSLLKSNPCEKGGRLYKGGDRAEIVWQPADITALAREASPEVMSAVILALWTGQRQGDLLRLSWTAYDGRTITLKQAKTGKRVSIPVGETLRQFLDGLEKTSTQILTSTRGTPWTTDGFKSSFYRACERPKIGDLHFHDLRGTAVTRLALSGCEVPQIASFTGHSLKDVEMLLEAHYLGGRVELAEQAALKLESRFGETVS